MNRNWYSLHEERVPMDETRSQSLVAIKGELHFSPRWIAAALIVASVVFVSVADANMDPDRWLHVLYLTALSYFASVAIWLLDSWKTWLGRWCAVIAVAGLAVLGLAWMDIPAFLGLAVISPGLAIALISVPAGVACAAGVTLLLELLTSSGVLHLGLVGVVVTALAIWGTLAMVMAMYRRTHQLAAQLWEQYRQVQNLLEESRTRKAELEQITEELMRANRQLDLLTEKLDVMRLAAEEAQKSKSMFVAKVSHEFRTPLNMIIGLTDVVMETPEVYGSMLPPALLEDLEIVHRNCRHLSEMINDVLDLSQAETGQAVLHREWVELGDEIDAAVAVVRPLVQKKGLNLGIIIPDDLPRLYVDRTRIRQVILNLLSNAARFTAQGGITVQVVFQDQRAVVSVADTGPGISPEDAQKIFDPFCQGTSRPWRDRGGSGLGLTISKQFVELHGGEIWLESEPGRGSTFSFSLPARLPGEPTAGPGRWIGEDWVWTERAFRPHMPRLALQQRIVVCDETGTLHTSLERQAGDVELVETHSLTQVLGALKECPAHAVVFNAASPDGMWQQVARAQQQISDTPILAFAFPPRIIDALEAGAIGYLIKPVTRDKLMAAFRATGKPIERVLVVDDNLDVQQLLRRMLSTCPQVLEVTMAPDGEQALHELRSQPPDVMLLDILLPGMDGWQVLECKMRDETICAVPVIMLSAQDPTKQVPISPLMVATMGNGLTASKALRCILDLSTGLLKPG
jgi:signal transduction histidine kinase/DNA-binding response OmpR family regulator